MMRFFDEVDAFVAGVGVRVVGVCEGGRRSAFVAEED